MDDMEDDERYNSNPKPYSLNHHHNSSSSSHHRKIHIRNSPYSHRPPPPPPPPANRYHDEDEDDDDDAIDDAGEYQNDAVVVEQQQYHNGFEWHPKKRKLKNLEYELAPRVKYPTPPLQTNRFGSGSGSRPGPEEESWTEHAVFVLLEVWGDRFLQLGRKSLRSEDWADVAQKVSEESKMERSEKQCRNMLDMLKRKYKKEKARIDEMGGGGGSKWGYYKKMEMLMANSMRQECGLACGVDSGEYVFMNTQVYLEKSNGFDEMRDSPGESETDEDEDEDEEEDNVGGNGVENAFPGLPRFGGGGVGVGGGGLGGSSYRVLADSIHKFGEIYENIESSKRQQMMELEKMRREFNKEMELQKKQILERAQAEIAKIQEANDDDDDDEDDDTDDASAEELSE